MLLYNKTRGLYSSAPARLIKKIVNLNSNAQADHPLLFFVHLSVLFLMMNPVSLVKGILHMYIYSQEDLGL